VYALIDDAETRHRVIKLYKGSHGSSDPHLVVLEYGKFFAAQRRGVLGFACEVLAGRHSPIVPQVLQPLNQSL
jgi:hypothetical protein